MNSALPPDKSGLLLVGHGTRLAEGTDEFRQLASLLASRLDPIPVEGCLLEFQHPTIPEGWQRLIERGVDEIRVAPLLLFAAGHARRDIPELVQECLAESQGVSSSQAGPLSRAPSIIDLLVGRIEQAAIKSGDRINAADALVMVGRGSHDPCAQADMKVLGEVVAWRCGIRNRHVAFYAMAVPRLAETLDRVATASPGKSRNEISAPVRRIIVQPHLLFRGRLYDSIVREVQQARKRHPEIRFTIGDYLGPTEEIAEAVVRRAFPGVPYPGSMTA